MIKRAGVCCVVLVFAAGMSSAEAADEYHRWTDENGTVHYSKELPPDTVSTSVSVKTEKAPVVSEVGAKEPVAETAPAPEDEVAAKMRAMEQDLCDRAKESLRILDEGQSIQRRSTATGETRPLVGAERDAARLEAVAQVDTFCSASNATKSGE